jgi:plastocyanin
MLTVVRMVGWPVAVALGLVHCGGPDSGITPPPPPSVLDRVSISPATLQLFSEAPGNTATVSVSAVDQKGVPVSGLSSPSFSSSDPAVAAVSQTGTVTGVAAGAATVTASLTVAGVTRTASTSVTVVARTFANLFIQPASLLLFLSPHGESGTFTTRATDQTGVELVNIGPPTFTIDDPAVATLSESGTVTAVSHGSTHVTASLTVGGVTRTAVGQVTVGNAAAQATVSLQPGLLGAQLVPVFAPDTVDLALGGIVTWVGNPGGQAPTTHTVTFTVPGGPPDIGEQLFFNNPTSRTFNTQGIFPFVCTLHPFSMKGVVRVH